MSNTIDERVVILKFDNKDFETNAQQSLATLDKLDKGLDLKNAGNSLKGIAVSSKSLGLDGIGANVDALTKRFSNLGIVGMTALQEITKTAMRTGASIIRGVFNPIVQGGKRRAMNIEQADFMLHGVLSDEQQIQDVMDAASRSVDGTAYSLDAAAKAASQFAAAGVQAGEELDSVLKAVAGTSATFNADYQSVSNIFTKIASSGRVMGDEMNMLVERGVPAYDTLVSYINGINKGQIEATESVTEYVKKLTDGMEIAGADVQEFQKKGLLSFELFSSAMSYSFGDHAKDANNTLTGVLSNINAALARTGAMFYAPLIKQKGPLVTFLDTIRLKINEFNKALAPFASAVTEAINVRILPALTNFVSKIEFSPFGKFISGISKAIRSFFGLGEAIEEAVEKPKKAVEELEKAIKTITPEEAQAAWDIWNKGTYGNGEARKKALAEAGLSYENVQGYVNELIAADFDLEKVETKVADSIKDGADKSVSAKEKINEAVEKQKKELSPAVKLWLSFKYAMTGIGSLAKTIGGVFKKVASNFKMTVKPLDGITDGLLSATSNFMTFASSLKISDETAKNVSSVLKGLLSVLQIVGTVALKVAGFLGNVLFSALKLVGGALAKFFAGINNKIEAYGGISAVLDRIKESFVRLGEGIKNSSGFQKFVSEIGKVKDAISQKFVNGFDTFTTKFKEFTGADFKAPTLETFISFIDKFLSNIGTFIENLRTGKGAVVEFFNSFKSKFKLSDIFSFGGDNEGDAGGGMLSQLTSIKDKIVEALKGIFTDDGAGGAVEKIKDFFKKIEGVLGEVEWDKLVGYAKDIMKLYLAFRMIKNFDKLTKSLTGVFSSVSGLAKAAKTKLKMDALKSFAMSVGIIVGAIAVLTQVPQENLEASVNAIIKCLLLMLAAVAILDKLNTGMGKMYAIGVAFAGMGAGILLAAIAAKQINELSDAELMRAGKTILKFVIVMGLAARLAGGLGGIGFASMAISLYILAPALIKLAEVPVKDVNLAALALAKIMGALGLAARLAGSSAGGALKILALALAVDLILPAFYLMASMPWEKTLQGALAVGGIMLALGFAAKLAGESAKGAGAMLATAVAAVAAALAIYVIGNMSWDQVAQGVFAIILVIGAIAEASTVAEKGKVGALAIMGVLVVLAIVFVVLTGLDIGSVMAVAMSLSLTLAALTLAIGVLGNMPISAGATAAANLLEFIGILGGALTAVGALFEEFPTLETYLDKGIEILKKLATGLGEAVAGFAEGLTSTLPDIGQNLGDFYSNAQPFFEGMSGIDASIFDNVSSLVGSLVEMTGGGILEKISGLFGGSSGNALGKSLNDFADPIVQFAEKVRGLTEADTQSAGIALGIAKAFSDSGSDLSVPSNLTDIGTQLSNFGEKIIYYSKYMSKVDTSALSSSTTSVKNVITTITSVSQNGSGLDNLKSIGKNLSTLAESLGKASSKAGKIDLTAIAKISAACSTLAVLAAQTETIDTGKLASFASNIGNFFSAFTAATKSGSKAKAMDFSGINAQIDGMANLIKKTAGLNASSISKFIADFNKAGSQGVDGFIRAFTNAAGRARSAAASIVTAASGGLSSVSDSASSTAYNVGINIANGLIRGMDAMLGSIRAKYNEAGRLAAEMTKVGARVNSPSKISMEAGEGIGEGLVLGMNHWLSRVTDYGEYMGKESADSVTAALSRIGDIINGDISDDLVITPVLDLSNVERDAGQIGSLLGTNQTVALNGRVNSVGAAVGYTNRRDELASAIKSMNRSKGDVHNWNINIDGAKDPETYMDKFVRTFKQRTRTRMG